MKLESSLDKRCKTACTKRGWLYIKLDPMNAVGIPDRLVVKYGVVWFVELKRPDGKGGIRRKAQLWWAAQFKRLGQNYLRTDSFAEFERVILADVPAVPEDA